jgi:hypothetical protein
MKLSYWHHKPVLEYVKAVIDEMEEERKTKKEEKKKIKDQFVKLSTN